MNLKVQQNDRDVTDCSASRGKAARSAAFLAPLIALNAFVVLPSESANAASCHYYAVNIQGTVANNFGTQQFSVNQYAMWRDVGVRTHPVEFWLTTNQNLNASAQVGQIELMTNTAFANNAGIASAGYDLAAVSVSNVVNFVLDSGAGLIQPPPNVFVGPGPGSSPGGLGGLGFLPGAGADIARFIGSAEVLSTSFLIPLQGGGYFSFPNGNASSIAGQLDLVGTTIDNMSLQGRYTASFGGNYISSTAC